VLLKVRFKRTSYQLQMDPAGSRPHFFLPVPNCQLHGNSQADEVRFLPVGTPHHSQARLRGKRVSINDISPANHKRTNGLIAAAVNGGVLTPEESPDGLHINPRSLHNRSYLPSQIQNHLVYSCVAWKWRGIAGKELDLGLHEAAQDEMNRPKSGAKKKTRRIELTLLANVLWGLMSFLYSSRYLRTRAEALVQCIFQVLVKEYPELFKDVLLKESRIFIREHVTLAHKFQKMIDNQPTGALNYGSIEGIRKGVEELCRYEIGIIPSRSTIARCARKLEQHASVDHGLEILETITPQGPVFSFEIYNFIRTILRGFGLIDHAKTGSSSSPVMICWTLDYAQLTRELGHLTGGLKIVDPRSVDPITGNPLVLSGKFQSRDLSFPCRLAFSKDSKEAYKECFGSFFQVFNAKSLVVPATETEPELSNFNVSSCQDLSSGWKTTTLGGGCKSTEYFCPQCMVSRKTVADYNIGDKRCATCIRLGMVRCYCRDVIDDNVLESTRRTLSSYIELAMDDGFERFDRIAKKSKIQFDAMIAGKERNKVHIDFEPRSTKERNAFIMLLNEEISIRLVEAEHNTRLQTLLRLPIDKKRNALKEFGMFEAGISLARLTINRHDVARNIAISLAVEQLIPSILQMKWG
jgi:hypothetical protein